MGIPGGLDIGDKTLGGLDIWNGLFLEVYMSEMGIHGGQDIWDGHYWRTKLLGWVFLRSRHL